jgi:hypothetical protein
VSGDCSHGIVWRINRVVPQELWDIADDRNGTPLHSGFEFVRCTKLCFHLTNPSYMKSSSTGLRFSDLARFSGAGAAQERRYDRTTAEADNGESLPIWPTAA